MRLPLRSVIVAGACAWACAGVRAPAAAWPSPEADALALADAYVAAWMARYPELATILAYPAADHAAVFDNRPEAFRAWAAREDSFLARARAVRGVAAPSRGWIALAMVKESLEASIAARACRVELWGVSALGGPAPPLAPGGWQDTYAALAEVQPVGTPELRRAAVARLAAVPAYVDREIANLREGVRLGFTPTRANVERVVAELDELLAAAPEASPFLRPAERDPAPELRRDLARVLREGIAPAARRYRDFLAIELLPRARTEVGVAALPDGAACYRAAIRAGTTLALSPEELHALGLAQLAAIRGEMRAIAERSFGTADVPALLRRLRTAPEHRFRSEEEVVARARAAVERARRALPAAFSLRPRNTPEVRPYPAASARAGAPAMSSGSATADGYRGIYFINTWGAASRSRLGDVSTAFHETFPGHVLEGALKVERPGATDAERFLVNNAYTEGWALYAERLSDELGLFESDFDRLGMLSARAFRAARLVVDTGIHAFGWSRERAAAFLADELGGEPARYLPEVDRYCAWPGQALGYLVGALEIEALRDGARRALGGRFDLRAFHAVVLEAQLPLGALGERVGEWVRQTEPSAAGSDPGTRP